MDLVDLEMGLKYVSGQGQTLNVSEIAVLRASKNLRFYESWVYNFFCIRNCKTPILQASRSFKLRRNSVVFAFGERFLERRRTTTLPTLFAIRTSSFPPSSSTARMLLVNAFEFKYKTLNCAPNFF